MPPDLDAALLVQIALCVAGFALWFAAYAGVLLVTRPADVPPNPPTQDFGGDEPPAVVSLLTNRWELTEDAAESTLIDLAATRVLELRQPANDPMHTTVHVREGGAVGLTRYQQMVFDRVNGLVVNGLVPLTALTFRDRKEADAWRKRFDAAVVDDARRRGLSRRRISPTVVSALAVLAAIPALAVGAVVAVNTHPGDRDGWGGVAGAVVLVWAALAVLAGRPYGERDTPPGRQVAARWLGLKAFLRNDTSFADLPPAAVAVWDRYLSYGDAVGATRVCSAVIDLGMGNRRRVWSSFGGTWHRVRVRYPFGWPRYGQPPVRLFVKAGVTLLFALLVTRLAGVPDSLPPDAAGWARLAFAVLFGLPLAYGLYTLIATIIDLATPVTVTGEVLWVQVWRTESSSSSRSAPTPWLHHLAVDDGRDDRTVAWGCPTALVGQVSCGDVVTIVARRWTRRVTSVEVREQARSRVLASIGADSDPDTENIVHGALAAGVGAGAQALASALRTPDVTAGQLLSLDEVSRALGTQVATDDRGTATVGPVSMATYHAAADGTRLLLATVSTGPAARLAMNLRSHGQPLPGIGTEAYAWQHWAMARHNGHVVMPPLHGPGRQIDPRNLYWLLSTAVSRLPG
jgi:Predicted membrane protein (DUF2207)